MNVASGLEGGDALNQPEDRETADGIGWHRPGPEYPGPVRLQRANAPRDLVGEREHREHAGDEEQLANFDADIEAQ